MQYFASDLHLGDKNIIKYEKRPFSSVDEMNEAIISNFASVVGPKDDLWMVVDFVKGANTYLEEGLFRRVPGRKHLIPGNHDRDTIKKMADWASVDGLVEMKADGQPVTLCHYPLMTWNGAHHGGDDPSILSIQIFGHIHGLTRGWWRAVNVSVDVWDFMPVTIEQIRQRSAENRFVVPMHEDVFEDRKRITHCSICNADIDRGRDFGGYVMKEDGVIATFSGKDILKRRAGARPSRCLEQPAGASICEECLDAEMKFVLLEGEDYDRLEGDKL
jgi:calcineurin-like phosphoesterase family protein